MLTVPLYDSENHYIFSARYTTHLTPAPALQGKDKQEIKQCGTKNVQCSWSRGLTMFTENTRLWWNIIHEKSQSHTTTGPQSHFGECIPRGLWIKSFLIMRTVVLRADLQTCLRLLGLPRNMSVGRSTHTLCKERFLRCTHKDKILSLEKKKCICKCHNNKIMLQDFGQDQSSMRKGLQEEPQNHQMPNFSKHNIRKMTSMVYSYISLY